MIHTTIELFSGYMLIFWLLQNFYMSIAVQSYKRIYTIANLLLIFTLNSMLVGIAYGIGSYMLFAHSMYNVLCMSVAFVCLIESMFWYAHGWVQESKGIVCAQVCAALTLCLVYLIAEYYG